VLYFSGAGDLVAKNGASDLRPRSGDGGEVFSVARLRVRLRFNPGRVGSPMDKLGEYASQTEKFLRSFCADLGVQARKGEWLARDFSNDSVAFDGELAHSVPDAVAMRGFEALVAISGDNPLGACDKGLVGYTTMAEFAKIGRIMDPDEHFCVGLYADGAKQPSEWRQVSYQRTAEIRQLLDAPLVSHGSVQGTIHSWHTGTRPMFFQLRELSTGILVHCDHDDGLYERVHEATRSPKTVIHAHGRIRWDRGTNAIMDVETSALDIAEPLSDSEFERLLGSAPNFTGTMSTADYIEWLRGDAE
jgi:hypothetical protein